MVLPVEALFRIFLDLVAYINRFAMTGNGGWVQWQLFNPAEYLQLTGGDSHKLGISWSDISWPAEHLTMGSVNGGYNVKPRAPPLDVNDGIKRKL